MFRKFYTNSSSLSYPFPPRSTLAGLIAGLMGYERDSYSEDLGLEQCKIAVSVQTPVRSVMQTINYLKTVELDGFHGADNSTQVPVEWIFPEIDNPKLRYRVYITNEDRDWLEKLNTLLTTDTWIYPPYLGMSECLAQIAHVATVSDWTFEQPENATPLTTIIPVQALDGAPELIPGSQIVKERIPLALDHERKLEAICDVLYERTGKGITAHLNRPAFHVSYEVQGSVTNEIGVFLE